MWNSAEIHNALLVALTEHARALENEQAVRGLDAMSEVALHPVLAEGLRRTLGVPVLREQPFPADSMVRLGVRPKRAERERCDMVLLPSGTASLRDAVAEARRTDELAGTLFSESALTDLAASPDSAPDAAFWLEVKVVGQFVIVDGAARANRAYSTELRRALKSDLTKLSRADQVRSGALALVLFTLDEATARHDWSVVVHEAAFIQDVGWQRSASFLINERIGNRCCFVGLMPVEKP